MCTAGRDSKSYFNKLLAGCLKDPRMPEKVLCYARQPSCVMRISCRPNRGPDCQLPPEGRRIPPVFNRLSSKTNSSSDVRDAARLRRRRAVRISQNPRSSMPSASNTAAETSPRFPPSRLFGRLSPCILPRPRLAGIRKPLTNPAETVATRFNLRVAFLAAIAWLNPRPNKMQDHRHDRQEANAIPKHSQHPENEKLRGERAGFQAVIGEILSEEDHQAAQRKLGAAQLRIARSLNRITAIGAIWTYPGFVER